MIIIIWDSPKQAMEKSMCLQLPFKNFSRRYAFEMIFMIYELLETSDLSIFGDKLAS